MNKIKLLILVALISSIPGFGQIPQGYYDPANGLTGTALKTALHNIIKGHTVLSYSSLYSSFESTDAKPNGTVWDMYSDIPDGTANGNPPYVYNYVSGDQCGNYNGEGDCYNREHSFPASWFSDASPMYTDLFHLLPTDGYVNNRRSNYPLGNVGTVTWMSQNGSKLGDCSAPGYSGTVFEPIDAFKGDFARSYFYMSVRYYTEDSGWPGSPMVTGSQLKPWALEMLKLWSSADPVSTKEINRNNAVYADQHNRNPFIDHPEYVAAIYGGNTGISDVQEYLKALVYPNPVVNSCQVDVPGLESNPNVTLLVYDITGRKEIADMSRIGNHFELNTSVLLPGIHILCILDGNGKVITREKIVK
ncbi:MAG: endonuclease [Bacteroidales bacterium]